MANSKHIIFTLIGSVVLIGIIALWMGHRTGEVSLLGSSGDTQKQEGVDGTIPGPLSADETAAITQKTLEANTTSSTTHTMDTKNPTVTLRTSKGIITLEMYADVMPITTGNFIKLAKEGFYNNTKFHRVIEGFMIQGGDPNTKSTNSAVYGQGGPGYTIQDEFIKDPRLTNVRGTIAMANTGQPNSGGSQFFINLVDNTGLDFDKPPMQSSHPVFGRVVAGMDVVDSIGSVERDGRDLPVDPIVIEGVTVEGM